MGVAQRSKAVTTTVEETSPDAATLDQAIENTFRRAADPSELIFDDDKFASTLRFAKILAQQSILPKHLSHEKVNGAWKELSDEVKTANCFRVVNQASRWGVDPFAIIDLTYVVGGKLGYEGKCVAGILNSKAGLDEPMAYEFSGTGHDRTVTVTGTKDGASKSIEMVFKDAATVDDKGNFTKQWTRDPDQKLIYSGVLKWARRHMPEVLLGILTEDDLLRIEASENAKSKPRKRRKSVKQEDALTSSSRLNEEPADEPKEPPAEKKPAEKAPAKSKAADKPAPKKEAKKPPAEDLPPWYVGLEAALADAASADAVQVIYDERVEQCASPAARAKLAQLCDERGDQFPPPPTAFDLAAARKEIGKADTLEVLNAIKAKWLPSCKEDDEFNLDKLIDSRQDDIAETRGEAS